jgi:glycosyltransferase involved in cell wall biosynthesis
MKITHVISGLAAGGAQVMLYKLLSHMNRRTFSAKVISLVDVGPMDKQIRKLGVPVQIVGMRPGVPNPLGIYRLARLLKHDPPHLLQTWMYHADLIGGLATRLAGGIPVVWNIRHGSPDSQRDKRATLWTVRACAKLSGWLPTRIVCCAEVSRQSHTELGYMEDKITVIPNGFDLEVFKPNSAARLSVRQELGVATEGLIIGLVGRFHPLKGHRDFIDAAGRLYRNFSDVHFLLCGDGVTAENTKLAHWIDANGVRDRCHLIGERHDIARINAALDIACSASYAEGFPNVIGEAMACGVPCVVTNVGDSALVVGGTGKVVPARDPEALANAWRELIAMGPERRSRLGAAARHRIVDRFSLQAIAARYENLYQEVAGS